MRRRGLKEIRRQKNNREILVKRNLVGHKQKNWKTSIDLMVVVLYHMRIRHSSNILYTHLM